MPRTRKSTRRTPKSNPRGVLDVRMGGYGFVKTSEGEFFVPAEKMGGAFDGDTVEVALLPGKAHGGSAAGARKAGAHGRNVSSGADASRASGEKRAVRVVRVLGRAHETIIGRYEIADPFGVVIPQDPRITHDIFTQRADNPDIPDGALVRVRITTYPVHNIAATGVVEEVLGDADTSDYGVELIVARHKLETVFSDAAVEQASKATLGEQDALECGYRDIRERLVCTIDPVDARDFDDALSLERVDGLWRIGVHIADVSHYVPWDSSIDLDARRRATSVYLVDRVIPMLPEKLSNDICSLKPGELRRTMTVDLFVDDDAQLVRAEIYPALIMSGARLTYGQVQEVLGRAQASGASMGCVMNAVCGSRAEHKQAGGEDDFIEVLENLSMLASKRARSRSRAGGLDFDTREAKVRLDAEGRAIAIDIREKTEATQLVEEMMIWANEVVAGYLGEREHPCIFRTHEKPVPDALASLIPVLQEFDWFARIDEYAFSVGNPHALAMVLDAAQGRPEGELANNLILRAMQRAVYSPHGDGHYGLGLASYCHFTSPIRRYPDLVVHRMLKDQLMREGKISSALAGCLDGRTEKDKGFSRQCSQLKWLSEHSSEMERTADAAARQSQEYKMIEYMQDFVGCRFAAVISGVATYGIYVQLDNTAEGLLPIRDLGDEYFALDPARYILTGADTGKQFRLGGRIAVVLREADCRTRTLRFSLVR